jgi:telomere length regulation protein
VDSSAIIEEFFKNQYSITQRYAMLNALALGARELASMALPSSQVQSFPSDRLTFPSKLLPPHLHRKYVAAQERITSPVRELLDGISRAAIESGNDASAERTPESVRERQLRIRKPARVSEVKAGDPMPAGTHPACHHKTTFMEVAAEFFIAPLINRFWLFLRDEQTREERTAHHELLHRYRGAGTGLILNPMILQQFLGTLAVLVHASQNAPEWLAVVAPNALELAVAMGTRPVSIGDVRDEEDDVDVSGPQEKEAAILTTALELALVILNSSLNLDGGRSLSLEHTALLLGTAEWAGQVFSRLEKGALIEGGGGELGARLHRAAAGVLLKVDEMTSKWRRSMIDVG